MKKIVLLAIGLSTTIVACYTGDDSACPSGVGSLAFENAAGEAIVVALADESGDLDPLALEAGDSGGQELPVGKYDIVATGSESGRKLLEGAREVSCAASTTVKIEPLPRFTLSVLVADIGGAIVSEPAGIRCTSEPSSRCASDFDQDQPVTLTAVPEPGYEFGGWQARDCSGASPLCTTVLSRATLVQAWFTPEPAAGQRIRVSGKVTYQDGRPFASAELHASLILSGLRLFEGTCDELDIQMEGGFDFGARTDADGKFSSEFPFSGFSALVDAGCKISKSGIGQAGNLMLAVSARADAESCRLYCAASEASNDACEESCVVGERKLVGRLSFDGEQLVGLEALSGDPAGTVEIPADFTLGSLGVSLTATDGADLQVDGEAAAKSLLVVTRAIKPDSCAVQEGCVGGSGDRRLLRFDGMIRNLGKEDFVIGSPENSPDLFSYSSCHGHYHLKEAMAYELLDAATRAPVVVNGRSVVGHKQGYCMVDMEQVAGDRKPKFTCSYQGLSSGWSDVYLRGIDCQWVDVTDVPPGDYLLRITVNPGGTLPEADKTNNSAEVPVTLTGADSQ